MSMSFRMVSTTFARLSIETFSGLMITNLKITPMIAPTEAKIPQMRDTVVNISTNCLLKKRNVKNIGDTLRIPKNNYRWTTVAPPCTYSLDAASQTILLVVNTVGFGPASTPPSIKGVLNTSLFAKDSISG